MKSKNQSDVARDIEEGKGTGRYKDCQHLHISKSTDFLGTIFSVACSANSLFFADGGYQAIREDAQTSCPSDCRFFLDRVKVEAEKTAHDLKLRQEQERRETIDAWKKRGLWIVSIFTSIFSWYNKQPWQTQCLILLIVLAVLAPRFVEGIVAIIKAVK